jgi:hypothetical protein
MSVLGACWRQGKVEKKNVFGKENMHEESDSWKEAQHAHMQGRQQLEGITTHMHGRKT